MNLKDFCEVFELTELLEDAMKFLPHLPPPERIRVDWGHVVDWKKTDPAVKAMCGLTVEDEQYDAWVSFREKPPSEYAFVHELIHLGHPKEEWRKDNPMHEANARNLPDVILFYHTYRKKHGEKPYKPFNLIKLYDTPLTTIMETLKQLLNIDSLQEFYHYIGTIPIDVSLHGDEKEKVFYLITYIIDGMIYGEPWGLPIFRQLASKL